MARRRSRARTGAAPEKPPASASAEAPAWDADVPAHAQTWMYLFLKGEVLTSFPDSRELRMRQMAWWNGLATPDVRRIDAEKVAIALHRFFKDAMRRPYESEFEQNGFAKSILALTEVLVVADETLPALAAVVDRIFRFENEA
jgi:hypothetical protein